jgi:hypothetical protein
VRAVSDAEAIWPNVRFERGPHQVIGYSLLVDGDIRKSMGLRARIDGDDPQAFDRACGLVREAMRAFVEQVIKRSSDGGPCAS